MYKQIKKRLDELNALVEANRDKLPISEEEDGTESDDGTIDTSMLGGPEEEEEEAEADVFANPSSLKDKQAKMKVMRRAHRRMFEK